MDIYEQIVQLRREGRRGAVATIVNVRGSVPSFRTAKMLVVTMAQFLLGRSVEAASRPTCGSGPVR